MQQSRYPFAFNILSDGGNYPRGDIFLVHGLYGDAKETWTYHPSSSDPQKTAKKHGKFHFRIHKSVSSRSPDLSKASSTQNEPGKSYFWPETLLFNDYPDHAIITCQYRSSTSDFFRDHNHSGSAYDIAGAFLRELVAWKSQFPLRPSAFICHSLGGIIAALVTVLPQEILLILNY
jgi:hypothetical protein